MKLYHALTLILTLSAPAISQEIELINPSAGVVDLIASDPTALTRVDGLAFDQYGNLFASLEINNPRGGISYIDIDTGQITAIASGIYRACQVAVGADGNLYVSSEINPPSQSNRLYQVIINYDNNIPTSATTNSITTPSSLGALEGVYTILQANEYGPANSVIVGEDRGNGQILVVDPATGISQELVPSSYGLSRPEGIIGGDFGGDLPYSIYVAETGADRIISIAPDGTVTPFGDPTAINLQNPDNIEFGPDGYLYIIEDVDNGRLIRADSNGVYSVVANLPSEGGLVFDNRTGDLYISQQSLGEIYRIRFALNLMNDVSLTSNEGAVAKSLDDGFIGSSSFPLRVISYDIKKMTSHQRSLALSEISPFLISSIFDGVNDASYLSAKSALDHLSLYTEADKENVSIFTIGTYADSGFGKGTEKNIDLSTYALSSGLKYKILSDLTIGAAFSYTKINANSFIGNGEISSNANGILLFAAYTQPHGFNASIVSGLDWYDTDYSRETTVFSQNHTLGAQPDVSSSWIAMDAMYKINMNKWLFGPHISIFHAKSEMDAFIEEGSNTLALSLSEQSLDSTIGTIGIFASRLFGSAKSPLSVHIETSLKQIFGSASKQAVISLAGAPDNPFNYTLSDRKGTYGEISIQMNKTLTDKIFLSLSYNKEIGNKYSDLSKLSAGLNFSF